MIKKILKKKEEKGGIFTHGTHVDAMWHSGPKFHTVFECAGHVAEGGALDLIKSDRSASIWCTRGPLDRIKTRVALIVSYNGSDLIAWDASKASNRDPTTTIKSVL